MDILFNVHMEFLHTKAWIENGTSADTQDFKSTFRIHVSLSTCFYFKFFFIFIPETSAF